jgi:Mg-chelatase subunit ChlD
MNTLEVQQADIGQPQPPAIDREVLQAGIAQTAAFLEENAGHLGRVFGVTNLNITVGKGWATNMESGAVTADPRFFTERGYTPDMAAYATMHEVAAHLREVIQEPALTRDVLGFLRQAAAGDKAHGTQHGEAAKIFHNIFADIAGNNYVHATLDATQATAVQLYSEKLFAEADYTTQESLRPRHLQFLYKVIRQEMIPHSETTVFPEVDAVIDSFRNFQGRGDLLKLSTAVADDQRRDMPARTRFDLWTKVIYPKYLELLEQDEQDPAFQKQAKPDDQQDEGQPGAPTQPGTPDFSEHYDDYADNRHPEPLSSEEERQIQRQAEKQQRTKERAEQEARDPLKQLDKKLREEIGHSVQELKRYRSEVERWRTEIQVMRDVYKLVINERVTTRRRLQGGHTEGVMLNPDSLAQTVIDVRSGVREPAAFIDYEQHRGEREITGKTDWIFIFDRSGSMQNGGKREAAAASSVICLEGLAAMQRDIEAAEIEAGMDLALDIRTAIYTFNGEVLNPKPLGHHLSEKERLDTYAQVANPTGNNADSVALNLIEGLATEPDRRKILVVLSDGEADDKTAARASVNRLRAKDWQVYGIAIGSKDAEVLYEPDSRRVDDPTKLPEAIQTLIQSNLT